MPPRAAAPAPPPAAPARPEDEGREWEAPFPEPRLRAEGPVQVGPGVAREPKDDTMVLEFDEDVGRLTPFPVEGDDDTLVVVLTGNPRITGKDLSVKATTIVVWLDRRGTPELVGYRGLAAPAAGSGAKKPSRAAPAAARKRSRKSVFTDQVLGVYAQGSVELVSVDLAFRAEELYLDPAQDYALLDEPRLDATTSVAGVPREVPLYVRAKRARIVGAGLAVFDRAEVSTSRANDRIALRVRRLTVEEAGPPDADEPTFLGFRKKDSRRYRASGIQVRGERLPLFYWPSASFGQVAGGGSEFPVRIRRLTTGSRSSLGRYAFLGVGGVLGPEDDPWLDWTVDLGGYTKRGLAGGLDLKWDRPRAKGRLRTFYVNDGSGEDRNGFQAPNEDRWLAQLEHRSDLTRSLRLDLEANDFSDRGMNREFFESDERNHKERETYARLRWKEGGTAATLTQMAHLRDFRTETILSPEAALWSESLPLGGGFDLSTEARAGRLERRFDDELPFADYEALRVDVSERVHRPFDVGDVRVSPFLGVRGTSYHERTDGGDDVTRLALETGIRANLQLHRDFPLRGGVLCLDGLRHVVDVDVGAFARALDEHGPEDVPFFDRHDLVEDRSEVFLSLRNRLETRRQGPFGCRNATVVDLRTRLSLWPGDVGPYGKRGPGNLSAKLEADLIPDRLSFRGQGIYDLGEASLEHGSIGGLWSPRRDLAFSGGLRHVHAHVLAAWVDAYHRWSEKWAGRVSYIRDLETGRTSRIRFGLLRFSTDHLIETSFSVRDDGRDVGFSIDFQPAIGGRPVSDPFDPREDFQEGP